MKHLKKLVVPGLSIGLFAGMLLTFQAMVCLLNNHEEVLGDSFYVQKPCGFLGFMEYEADKYNREHVSCFSPFAKLISMDYDRIGKKITRVRRNGRSLYLEDDGRVRVYLEYVNGEDSYEKYKEDFEWALAFRNNLRSKYAYLIDKESN